MAEFPVIAVTAFVVTVGDTGSGLHENNMQARMKIKDKCLFMLLL